jgi:hypothetical protein
MFSFLNELKTSRGNFLKMYIIEKMLSMTFNFLILTNYEFLTLSSTFDIKLLRVFFVSFGFTFSFLVSTYSL